MPGSIQNGDVDLQIYYDPLAWLSWRGLGANSFVDCRSVIVRSQALAAEFFPWQDRAMEAYVLCKMSVLGRNKSAQHRSW